MVQAVLFVAGLVADVALVFGRSGGGAASEQRRSIHRLRIRELRIPNLDRSPDGDG